MRRSAQPVNPAAPAHRPSLDSQKGRVEPPIQPLDKPKKTVDSNRKNNPKEMLFLFFT